MCAKPDSYCDKPQETAIRLPVQLEKNSEKDSNICCCKLFMGLLVMMLMLLITVVIVALNRDDSKTISKQNKILTKYDYMFQDFNSMATTDALISHEIHEVDETVLETNDTCVVTCTQKSKFSSILGLNENSTSASAHSKHSNENEKSKTGLIQEKGPVYHGCCVSSRETFIPDRLPNIQNQIRRLVQFKKRRQIFVRDVCQHVTNCNRGCKCMRQEVIVAALVDDDNIIVTELPSEEDSLIFGNARIELVRYPGCCKCFNQ